ncbi:MAG: thioredoxin fold domain-containing protein [Gammaproteobacteria bacterium]|nr:thioredoxin fold domain-containing protein [Gammaproteobacteria bacterium]
MKVTKSNYLSAICLACITLLVVLPMKANDEVESFVNTLMGANNQVLNIKPSELEGFYVATMQDYSVLYVSEDRRWIIRGDLIEIKHEPQLSLIAHTERHIGSMRETELNALLAKDVIAFAPPFESPKAVVHVFTDTTCGYCQKLHAEMADYHGKGIEIRYLAFPRAGIDSEPYSAMVSAWCSDTPHNALTQLKLGAEIETKTCENPVADQYRLGRLFGLRGTPLLVLSNGKTIGGYVNAEELEEILKGEGLM